MRKMSKIYKLSVYIDDINDMYQDIEDIKSDLENNFEDFTFTFEKVEERDTTEYLDEVGNNYEWNTTDEYTRLVHLHSYFAGNEVNND